MAENVFYLNLAAGCFLVYGIVVAVLRNSRARREREKLRAACAEIKRLQAFKSTEQQESLEMAGGDSPEALDGVTLNLIKQLQTELNQRVVELEREL